MRPWNILFSAAGFIGGLLPLSVGFIAGFVSNLAVSEYSNQNQLALERIKIAREVAISTITSGKNNGDAEFFVNQFAGIMKVAVVFPKSAIEKMAEMNTSNCFNNLSYECLTKTANAINISRSAVGLEELNNDVIIRFLNNGGTIDRIRELLEKARVRLPPAPPPPPPPLLSVSSPPTSPPPSFSSPASPPPSPLPPLVKSFWVFFDYGSDIITPEARMSLQGLANTYRDLGAGWSFNVIGYRGRSEVGDEEHSIPIRRASAVVDTLVRLGISSRNVVINPRNDEDPFTFQDTVGLEIIAHGTITPDSTGIVTPRQ